MASPIDLPPIATLDEPAASSPPATQELAKQPKLAKPAPAASVQATKPKSKPRPKPVERPPGQTLLPLPRVQKIMKADGELLPVSKEAVHIIAVATEEILKRLTQSSHKIATTQRRSTVDYRDIANAVQRGEQLQFLHRLSSLFIHHPDFEHIAETVPLAVPISVAFQRRNAKAGELPNGEGSHADSERRSAKGKSKARVNLIVNGKPNGKDTQPIWVGPEADATMMHWPPPHMYPPGYYPGWGPPPPGMPPPGMMPIPPGQPFMRGPPMHPPDWIPHHHMPVMPPHLRGAPPLPTHHAHPPQQGPRPPTTRTSEPSRPATSSRRSSRRVSSSDATRSNGNGNAHANGNEEHEVSSPSSAGASTEFQNGPGRTIYTQSLDPRLLQS